MESSTLIITTKKEVGCLISVLSCFQELNIKLDHIESRSVVDTASLDYFVQCTCSHEQLEALLSRVERGGIATVKVIRSGGQLSSAGDVPWFPKHITDLKRCCTNIFKYGTELTPDHPGYGDEQYKLRRKYISEVACQYTYGDALPCIEYSAEEIAVWKQVFQTQTKLYPTHACREYNEHYPALFEACGYRFDNIPQLRDVSGYLKAKTGWQLWPVIGWIPARDFLAALAFRVFPTTQYIRHGSSPLYTPEPDLCHELMGHAPLFCDGNFAQFSQELGLASLGVPDEWIDKLASLYWFTVEFGLCREDGTPKAYGAGLLSGNEELEYCVTEKPTHKTFDISQAITTKYPETGLQPLYFVTNSISDMTEKLMEFSKTIPRQFTLYYNPYSQSVEVLDNSDAIEEFAKSIHNQMSTLNEALKTKKIQNL